MKKKSLGAEKKQKKEISNRDLGVMIQGLGDRLDSNITRLDSKIDNLGDRLDSKIDNLTSYMKEGFSLLNEKIDGVDGRLSNQLEGINKRLDDMAENKVSNLVFNKLESRVVVLESKVLVKARK